MNTQSKRDKRIKNLLPALLLIGVCVLSFQNCAKIQFSHPDSQLAAASNVTGETTTGVTAPTTDTPTTSIPPESIPVISCATFVILEPEADGTLNVPARDSAQTCYAVKLLDAIENSASDQTKDFDEDTLANNQNIVGQISPAAHPYLMANADVLVKFAGARRISLSGGADQSTSILVDNFLMVGFGKNGTALTADNFKAYGTADAALQDQPGFVEYQGSPVSLSAFAAGHTASIGTVDISQSIAPNQTYELNLRADDCGGVRQLSDVYVVFE